LHEVYWRQFANAAPARPRQAREIACARVLPVRRAMRTHWIAAGLLAAACAGPLSSESLEVEGFAAVVVSDAGTTVTPPSCTLTAPTAKVAVSAGGRFDVELAGSEGAIAVLDAPDDWRAEVSASHLVGRAGYGGGMVKIVLRRTCAQGSAAATVTFDAQRLSWGAVTPWSGTAGPDAREHAAMWIDSGNPDRLLLFGGYSFTPKQYTTVWDLWALDLKAQTWAKVTTTTEPPHRAGGRVAPVAGKRAAMYFGGDLPDQSIAYSLAKVEYTPSAEAWSTPPVTSGQGPKGILGSFIYDAPRNRYISACGYDGAGINCAVDAFYPDTGEWKALNPALDNGVGPSPRYGFFHGYDEVNQRLVIFSGAQYPTGGNPVNPAQDTWTLELAVDPPRWVKLKTATQPPGRRNGCWAMDTKENRLFVWGGTPDAANTTPGLQVLELEKGRERWVNVPTDNTPPERSSCSGTYDSARHRLLYGFGNSSTGIYADVRALNL
jgi:hypothetical protein